MRYRAGFLPRSGLAAGLWMTVLGGCAVSDYQRPTIETVPPGDERIVFSVDVFPC